LGHELAFVEYVPLDGLHIHDDLVESRFLCFVEHGDDTGLCRESLEVGLGIEPEHFFLSL